MADPTTPLRDPPSGRAIVVADLALGTAWEAVLEQNRGDALWARRPFPPPVQG